MMAEQVDLFGPRPTIASLPLAEGAKVRDHGLRWYQQEADEAIRLALEKDRSTLLVMATGLGKTTSFGALAADWDGPVLILAHREELVQQAAARLQRMSGEQVEIEQGESRARPKARLVVASVQTLQRQARLDRMGPDRFSLVVADECFPAGTLVDGRPIERYRVGDPIWCVDHSTGRLAQSRVVRTFSKSAVADVVIQTGATAIRCTGNHPVFVRRGERTGYVSAESVRAGDMLCVRRSVYRGVVSVPGASQDVQQGVSVLHLRSEDGGDQPALRIQADEGAQPHGASGDPGEDGGDAEPHRASPEGARGQRTRPDGAPAGAAGGAWTRVDGGASDPDEDAAWIWVPEFVQGGPGACGDHGRGGSGRAEPFRVGPEGAGPEEGTPLVWARVDFAARVQPASARAERVYNLEVAGGHTYFANDVLVHNCHHYLAKTFRRPLDYFRGAKVLGVTATPDRGDEKALGQIFDSVAYVMGIRQGVDGGFLVRPSGATLDDVKVDLSNVETRLGDLVAGQLDTAMLSAVEAIVTQTLRHFPERKGIVFLPGVKTAELAAARFNALKPGSAAFVSGATHPEERAQIFADYRRGRYQFLCNCQIATEGFDDPRTDLVVMGRPTKSRALYAQMVGRGLRTLDGLTDHLRERDQADARRALIAASDKPGCVILDCVGDAGKHDLACPEDLLGGEYSDAEVALAKKKAKRKGAEGGDVLAGLEAARAELRELARKTQSTVTATVRQFDPFACVGLPADDGVDARFGRKPAGKWEREFLRDKLGFKDADLSGISMHQFARLRQEYYRRVKEGLASYKQMRTLARFGAPADLTFARASAAMTYLQQNGWRVADRARWEQIIHGQRQPGED